jgi:tetratricopeptide (TPR) repeat protein
MIYRKRVDHFVFPRRTPGKAARARSQRRTVRVARRSALAALISVLTLSSAFAQSDTQFAKANQEYTAGNFKEAIADYSALVDSGKWSANLFYDLGNAYFRVGDFGQSILNYQRALALEPHHPEARANLTLVRDEAHALELTPDRLERFLQFGNASQYAIAAAVALWIGLFSIAKLAFASRPSRGILALAVLSLLISAAAIFAAWRIEAGPKGSTLAIVTGDDVQARLATADTSSSVLALPPGSEIKILRRRGDWIYARLPNDLRGWIPEKSALTVRL